MAERKPTWKPIDLAGGIELGELSVSIVDAAIATMQERVRAGAPERTLYEALIPALRMNELRLPVIPESVSRAMKLMDDPEVDIGALALIVETDPALATKVVGVANSAYFHRAQPSSSVRDALMRMGLVMARNVVVAVALRSTLFRVAGFETEARALWMHSLLAALAAEAVVEELPPWRGSGFLLGLVHDVGRLATLSFAAARRDAEEPELRREWIAAAADALDGILGAMVLDSWAFPAAFPLAVRVHHRDLQDAGSLGDDPESLLLARALQIGDRMAHRIEAGWPAEEGPIDPELATLLEHIGLDASRGTELVASIEAGFETLSKIV